MDIGDIIKIIQPLALCQLTLTITWSRIPIHKDAHRSNPILHFLASFLLSGFFQLLVDTLIGFWNWICLYVFYIAHFSWSAKTQNWMCKVHVLFWCSSIIFFSYTCIYMPGNSTILILLYIMGWKFEKVLSWRFWQKYKWLLYFSFGLSSHFSFSFKTHKL